MRKCLLDEYASVLAAFTAQPSAELLGRGWAILSELEALPEERDMAELITLPEDPRPAIDVFVGYATGMVTDLGEVAHAAVHTVGYGLGIVHKHPVPVSASAAGNETIKGCCEEIKALTEAKGAPVGDLAAVDWASVIALALQIIRLFAQKQAA